MSAILGWIMKNPVLAGAGAAVAVLLVLVLGLKFELAGARSALADERARSAAQVRAYNSAAQARADAVSEAFAKAQQAVAQQQQRADELEAAVAAERRQRQNEGKAAGKRLQSLEAENAELRQWAGQHVPDAIVRWVREPTGAGLSSP